jgi:DNA-binding response OmpR family regulator
LARRPGSVVSRDALLEDVARRPDEVYGRVVDVHVANLRRKLGDDAGAPWLIETVSGAGYRLVAALDPA